MTPLQAFALLVGFPTFTFSFMIYVIFIRHRGMLKIRVKTPLGEKHLWRKPDLKNNSVKVSPIKPLDKLRKKTGEWIIKFDKNNLLMIDRTPKFLGRKAFCIDVFPNSTKAISYDYKIPKTHQPKWDITQSEKYIQAKILEKFGEELKRKANPLIWVVVLLGVLNTILLLLMTG